MSYTVAAGIFSVKSINQSINQTRQFLTRRNTAKPLQGRKSHHVKAWCDREILVWDRSRTLKMAPFDRPYTTFYWSTIVSIAAYCIIQVRGKAIDYYYGHPLSVSGRPCYIFQYLFIYFFMVALFSGPG